MTNHVPLSARRIPEESRLRRARNWGDQAQRAEVSMLTSEANHESYRSCGELRKAEKFARRARRYCAFAIRARLDAIKLLEEVAP